MRLARTRGLLISLIPPVLVLVVVAAVGVLGTTRIDSLTRDVVAIAGIHPLSGMLSNLGILLWCAAAAICLFVAIVIRNQTAPSIFLFLLASALLSTWLLLDDLFLIHEDLAIRYLGVAERAVVAALAAAVCGYLVFFRRTIAKTNYCLLIAALGFFASALLIEVLFEDWLRSLGHWAFFVEDGLKWLGISYWCSYFATAAHQFLVDSFQSSNTQSVSQAALCERISQGHASWLEVPDNRSV